MKETAAGFLHTVCENSIWSVNLFVQLLFGLIFTP